MNRREAYMLTVGKAKTWTEEGPHERSRRCVAFLLLYGVINRLDADVFMGRIAGIFHADEEHTGEPDSTQPGPEEVGRG